MIDYREFAYVAPPRTEIVVERPLLAIYEKMRWIAQVKKNGTNAVIFVSPEGEVRIMGRHENVLNWKMPDSMRSYFCRLAYSGWWVLNGELLHQKTPHIKDTLYLFDVLVASGNRLVGATYADRHKLLCAIFPRVEETYGYYVAGKGVWVSKCLEGDFVDRFDRLRQPEDEGLMCKNPLAKLAAGGKAGWMAKCRRPKKGYGF